jgi:hypothetical protein
LLPSRHDVGLAVWAELGGASFSVVGLLGNGELGSIAGSEVAGFVVGASGDLAAFELALG